MRRQFLVSFALAAITLAIYWPVRNYGLIEFDDPEFVRDKPEITSGLTWPNVRWAFSNPVAANWHPITTLSHMLDCQLFGRNLGAHHLVSVGIHAANSALLFLLLMQITGAKWRSALVAAIFAWHPLRVESVVWIAERKDALSGLFFILTLVTYAKYVSSVGCQVSKSDLDLSLNPNLNPSPHSTAQRSHAPLYYALSLLLFAVGLMSKPMLVTLPFVLLLLDYWPLNRWKVSGAESRLPDSHARLGPSFSVQSSMFNRQAEVRLRCSKFVFLFREKVPFLSLAAIVCWITIYLQKGGMPSLANISLYDRIANAFVSYLRYLGKAFWPTNLAIIYPHPAAVHPFATEWPDWEVALIALLLLAITVVCFLQMRARPYLVVGWLWYVGTMLPVIGIIQVGEQAMADRYTYLPLIGPTISLVWLCADLLVRRKTAVSDGPTPLAFLIAAPMLLACSILTHRQIQYWRDTATLFTHAAGVTANNSTAEFFIGLALDKQGEPEKAMAQYQVALGMNPYEPQSHYNLAKLLRKSGQWKEAAKHYEAVLQIRPTDSNSRLNLASVLPHLGRAKEATALYNDALRTDPDSIEALNNLAWLLATSPEADLRDGPRAVQLARRACELTQFKMTTLVGTLAAASAESGQFTDAVATAEKACALAAQSGDQLLLKKNRELLELYRTGHPYREPTE